jgi:2-polyprenyl-3-methyl-5-hydroxy-6-metoxy-1,4-benzoquinol methylase
MLNEKFAPTSEYYSHLRMPLLCLIDKVPKRVLEIGCASGQTLSYLKSKGAELTIGVEIFPEVAELAEKRFEVDRVIVGSIEEIDLDYPENYFDLIIIGFVIEHVSNPWAVMKKLCKLLKKDGQIVGSLPNVRHVSVILPLLFTGRWKYVEEGIMDWTHLRFFAKSTIIDLLEETGFKVQKINAELSGKKSQTLNVLTLNIFRNFFSYAYNFSAVKK